MLSTLNPTVLGQHIPQSEKEVSIAGVPKQIQREFLSQPVQMTLGPSPKNIPFLLCSLAPVNPLGRDFLSKLKGLVCFASCGDFTLEFPGQPEPDLLCSSQCVLDIEEEEFQQKSPI